MKKTIALLLAMLMVAGCLTGCGSKAETVEDGDALALSVTTTYAGNDGNAQNYKDACAAFTAETGIKINDSSATSDESLEPAGQRPLYQKHRGRSFHVLRWPLPPEASDSFLPDL